MILAAPFPAITTQVILPEPQLSDSLNSMSEVTIRRTMNGGRRTYVKAKGRNRLVFELIISRMKALELFQFFTSFASSKIRLTDHLGVVWAGNLLNNPFEGRTIRRSLFSPGDETVSIQLEFEGVKQ